MIKKESLTETAITNLFEMNIDFEGKNIQIELSNDEENDINETIVLANKVLGRLKYYDTKARERIIQNYLSVYNEDWREDEEPKLDEMQFNQNLTLTDIVFAESAYIGFYYNENNLFLGHTLIAQSFDGETFEDATMFG